MTCLVCALVIHRSTECHAGLQLAAAADLYVNDAFGSAHRAHASTEGVTHHLKPNVAGFLMQKVICSLIEGISYSITICLVALE